MDVRNLLIDDRGSVAERKRTERWAMFLTTFPDIDKLRVLDLGGTRQSWERAPVRPMSVHCLNPYEPAVAEGTITSSPIDPCGSQSLELAGQFDLVYSNSTIEHVGGHRRRQAFADVVHAAPRHWIQTPYRYFPIEPHVVAPLVQFLPLTLRARFSMIWPLHTKPLDYHDAVVTQMNTELLDATLMRLYFPKSEIRRERLGGLVKSLIAVQRQDAAFNLFGGSHRHVFATPYRGHLMCSNDYCAEMVTVDLQPLTGEQQDALRAAILADYEAPGIVQWMPAGSPRPVDDYEPT